MNQLPASFEVTLRFLSDWHIGTGQGRLGSVDAEVRRDGDDLPFVPAKTLVGVWRDACESVADVLDRAAPEHSRAPDAWQQWVTWLFGSQPARPGDPTAAENGLPVPAALGVTPARAPEPLRAAVRGRPALAQAAVVLRPGVTICDETGTAADGLLRLEERAIRGSKLVAEVSMAPGGSSSTDAMPVPAEILLRAGARLVESMGGKRSRGSGRVAVLLPGVTLDPADPADPSAHPGADPVDSRLAALLDDGARLDDPGPPPAEAVAEPAHSAARLSGDGWRTWRITLEVITPVVAADGVRGNVIGSRDAIPGTALLGPLLRRVERPGGIGLGDIRVSDAVPAATVGAGSDTRVAPAWPAPLVWYRGDKGTGKEVFNYAEAPAPPEDRAKPMSGRVAPHSEGTWAVVTTGYTVSTHAVIDDQARRPTTSGGGVFTYLGIAPGTRLITDVVLPADATPGLHGGDLLRFGRSRKDDFGMVKVCEVAQMPDAASRPEPTAVLRVWCVCDVLLRDGRLAPDPSPTALAAALTAALRPTAGDGLTLEVVAAGDDRPPGDDRMPADTQPTVVRADRREGFGVAWGRPRGSQVGLKGGSVVTLRVTGGRLDPAALAELELLGVGERTAEGFGRVRFDPPELTEARPKLAEPEGSDRAASDPSNAPDTRDAGWLTNEPHPFEVNAWRRAIREAAAIQALEPAEVIPGLGPKKPRKAQLGALRAQLERLALPSGEALVKHWLASTCAVERRQKKWGGPALEQLEKLLTCDGAVWAQLKLAGDQSDLVLAPGRESTLRKLLRVEAVTVLLTEVLRQVTHDAESTTEPTNAQDVT
jgi:CRISPR-associated protein Csx10